MHLRTSILFLTFVVFISSLVLSNDKASDDYPLQVASQIQNELQGLIRKLSPSVICVLPLPDSTSFDQSRRQGGGGGSGVIIDPEGYALTNFHVTEYAHINVGLSDGRLRVADVIARDEVADITLLKIRGGPYQAVEIGDSDDVDEGDLTVAMGNPFGLAVDYKPTTTLGILSGTNRYLDGYGGGHNLIYTGILQTDTPINPGNSGGPLFNKMGQLVGINGRISIGSAHRVSVGVGYAIPINMIMHFLPLMKRGEDPKHGMLGISLKDGKQVTVEDVIENSPAKRAGIKVGDQLISIDGHKLLDKYDGIHRLNSKMAGETVKIQLVRSNHDLNPDEAFFKSSYQIDVDVTLQARPVPVRLARQTKGISLEPINISELDQSLRLNEQDENLLEKALEKIRQINHAPYELFHHSSALAWSVIKRPNAQEAAAHPLSDGYLTSDEIKIFLGKYRQFIRHETHGQINQAVKILSLNENKAWVCETGQPPKKMIQRDVEKWHRRIDFSHEFFGKKENEFMKYHFASLKTEKIGDHYCYVLKTDCNEKDIQKYFFHQDNGLILAIKWYDKNEKLVYVREFKEFAKIDDRIMPISWQDKDGQGNVKQIERVIKYIPDVSVEPFLFQCQPSVVF